MTQVPRAPRRVLMFAYYFPPCNCWPTAAQRAYGLARGLADRGWAPVVITRSLPVGGCKCGAGRDRPDELEPEQDPEVVRVQTKKWRWPHLPNSGGLGLAGFIMGGSDDWTFKSRRAAQRYAGTTTVDLVWTTTGPIGSVRTGRFLQRTLDVPWVADLRDSVWRAGVGMVRGKGVKAWLLRKRAVLLASPLRWADAVVQVTLSEAQADAGMIQQHAHIIPSAFDKEVWSEIHNSIPSKKSGDDCLRVLFAGHVFPGRSGFSMFFEGVRLYVQSPQGAIRPIRVEYLGPSFARFRAEADGIDSSLTLIDGGTVSIARSREAMRDADALLLVTAPDTHPGVPGGKFYEYLAACRPILAVPGTDAAFVADMLQHTGHGVCAADAEAVRAVLTQLADGLLTTPAWSSPELQEFTWGARSRQLADVFETCLGQRVSGAVST